MASLRTLPSSKNFIACFTDNAGRRLQRSTGTHIRKDAVKIAEEYEAVARIQKTEAQIRRVLSDLYERIGGTPLSSASVRSFFTSWAEGKASESAGSTATKYRATALSFIAHLGARADLDLGYLTSADVLSYRDAVAKRVSTGSVNLEVKVLRIALNSAKRAGLIPNNPASQVASLKRKGGEGARRAFTLDELRRLLAVADAEWRGLVMFGLYSGQRLGDLARLKWSNLDLAREEFRFVAGKTGRQVILPMAAPLLIYLKTLVAPEKQTQPLFPDSFEGLSPGGGVGTLSNRFHKLMVTAGLVPPRPHSAKANGTGRGGRRAPSEISFHALRHTATSLLKNADVSDVVAREFIGHESAAVSKHYTHIETATLRDAAAKLPNLMEMLHGTKE